MFALTKADLKDSLRKIAILDTESEAADQEAA